MAEIVQFPAPNVMDIPAMARRFADDLETGGYGEVQRAIVVLDTGDGLHLLSWGECASSFEAIGIFEAAKIVSYESNFCDE